MTRLKDAASATSAWFDVMSGIAAMGLMVIAVVGSIALFAFLIGNKERANSKRKGSPIRLDKGKSSGSRSPSARDDSCWSSGFGSHGGCSSSSDSGGSDGGGCGGGGGGD